MNKISFEEIECIYRRISMAMDYRDAVEEELIKETYDTDWLSYNIGVALIATNKLSQERIIYEQTNS